MYPVFSKPTADSCPLHVIESASLDEWLNGQTDPVRAWIESNQFKGALGSVLSVPNENGAISMVLAGFGSAEQRRRGRFHLASIASKVPDGVYHLDFGLDSALEREEAALGWLLSHYQFDRYKSKKHRSAYLVAPEGIDANRIEAIAAGECLTRDLINTPTSDMGPDELENAFKKLAQEHGATSSVIAGDALLDQNFPLIHTVGRASSRAPRLLDMSWGSKGPHLTLVGKGVCFDTGGLNIKPGASMGLMKKDMGGAAAVMGLAHMIMSLKRDIRLRVLIPAVENAIDGSAFRPGDVLTSRKGLTVEINNTDAEGRLVLADALALASETQTDCIISMATLTGAARVAVGPDLAPFYCDDERTVSAIKASAERVADPVWEMPFHNAYEKMIEPQIADLDNAPSGGFAGSITAALFLRRFVEPKATYVHFDIYGWQPTSQPARPKGGVGQGTRAVLDALPSILGQ